MTTNLGQLPDPSISHRPTPKVNPPHANGAPVVRLNGLGKRFGDRWILRDAAMLLYPGERVALVGESGTGKSTILNIVAGLEPVTEGEVTVLDEAMHQITTDDSARLRRQAIGFVFQAFHLLPHLRVWQNVALPLVLNGADPKQSRDKATRILDRLSLAARATDWPTELSGGEQQRVALARALVHQPRVVLADEPTGNLDPRIASQAIELLHELTRETGASLLMVTHSDQAARAADRIVRIANQQLRDDPPR
jgi:putative ABC transport system ATP-binding protein